MVLVIAAESKENDMKAEYSMEEVLAYAEALREALRMHRAGRSTMFSLENSAAAAPDMLNNLAERIKADEGAVPDGYTALLSDGKRYWSDKPGEYGDWQPYFLGRPPAQAAQLSKALEFIRGVMDVAGAFIDAETRHRVAAFIRELESVPPTTEPAQAAQVVPTPQQISDYLAGLDSIRREIVEREARELIAEPVAQGEAGERINKSAQRLFTTIMDITSGDYYESHGVDVRIAPWSALLCEANDLAGELSDALAVQPHVVPDAGMPDANRFHFIVKYNWIGAKTRCEQNIQDGDLDSARRAVDAAMLAAAPDVPLPVEVERERKSGKGKVKL